MCLKKSKWTSVRERVPQEGGPFLVCVYLSTLDEEGRVMRDHKYMRVEHTCMKRDYHDGDPWYNNDHVKEGEYYFSGGNQKHQNGWIERDEVTHWMRLPDFPE